jgi:hypothetical protein
MNKILLILFLFTISVFSFSQSYESKSCGKCGKSVSIYSKIGDICPHCGVRWGHENTSSRISSSTSKNTSGLKQVKKIGSTNIQKNNTSKSVEVVNPFEQYSKYQLVAYIEENLNKYSKKYISCPDLNIGISQGCTTYSDYEIKIDDNFLIVKYNNDDKYDEVKYFPIYNFGSIAHTLTSSIAISSDTYKTYDYDFNSHKNQTSYVTIGFDKYSDPEVSKKIEQALKVLKKYYSKPIIYSLPNILFKSDMNRPSLAETQNWIVNKLNLYTSNSFESYLSYGSFSVKSPSFYFSGFDLIMSYNNNSKYKIPICECSVDKLTTGYSSVYTDNNYQFYSSKENIVSSSSYGSNNNSQLALKVNFHKEDNLFERMQKAFKNLKSYCPVVQKQKETF